MAPAAFLKRLSVEQQRQALQCFLRQDHVADPTDGKACSIVLFQLWLRGFIVRYLGAYNYTGRRVGMGEFQRNFATPHPIAQEQYALLVDAGGSIRCAGERKGYRGRHERPGAYEPVGKKRLKKRQPPRDPTYNPCVHALWRP